MERRSAARIRPKLEAAASRAICSQAGGNFWPSAPVRNRFFVASRWSFPLDVFGIVFGGTTSTTSGGMPMGAETCAGMACARPRTHDEPLGPPPGIGSAKRSDASFAHSWHLRHDVFDFVRVEVAPGV